MMMMHLLVLFCVLVEATLAAVCSESCSSEFTTKCFPFQCNKLGNASEAYAACHSESSGAGKLGEACGHSTCTDTDTMANLVAAGCSSDSGNAPPSGGNAPPKGGATTECEATVDSKPTSPALCTTANSGCCECASGSGYATYVMWILDGTVQRCIHTYNVPDSALATGARPVLLAINGYGTGKITPQTAEPAAHYGYAVIGVGSTSPKTATGYGLDFGNGGVANAANPTPCTASESRDSEYLDAIFAFIRGKAGLLDSDRVFADGFSQESMFAAFVSICYADSVAGLWQGGSGLALTGETPVTPGFQGQCSLASFTSNGKDCCATEFCTECAFWPAYPRTCGNALVDCIMAYTDDEIACGTDWNMYNAMVEEGNDARLLSFPGPRGHKNPENPWEWKVACLGLAEACDDACEGAFAACVAAASGATDADKFETCNGERKAGSLGGCSATCAPTLGMLQLSEQPVVTLSTGKFGTKSGVQPAAGLTAPKPECSFGRFDTHPSNKCQPPSGAVPAQPKPSEIKQCASGVSAPVASPISAPADAPVAAPVAPPAASTVSRGNSLLGRSGLLLVSVLIALLLSNL